MLQKVILLYFFLILLLLMLLIVISIEKSFINFTSEEKFDAISDSWLGDSPSLHRDMEFH